MASEVVSTNLRARVLAAALAALAIIGYHSLPTPEIIEPPTRTPTAASPAVQQLQPLASTD